MTTAAELAKHVTGDAEHRLTLLDAMRLRCHTCAQTVDLRPALTAEAAAVAPPPPTPVPPALHAPDRCETHPGQRAGVCGACRADALAAEERAEAGRPEPPDVDPYAIGAAAARAALAQVAARRRTETTEAPA